jgi:hypothetical protein
MEGRREQLVDDAEVEAVPVGGDLHGRDPGPVDRSVEEATGCLFVPPWREEDVDDLAELVDGPEQVAPGPAHPHVRLVDVPAITHHVPTCPSRFDELRGESLDPPVDAHVVDLDAALSQKLFHIPVRQTEPQVPPHRQRDHFRRKPVPGEGGARRWEGVRVSLRSHRASLSDGTRRDQCNSAAFLRTRGFRAIGIDLAEEVVRRATHLHRLSAFCVADATRLPFKDGAFEGAVDRGAFHYLSPEARRMYESELWRVLRPRGKLFLRACLRSAGVRNDIDAALLRSMFRRWREVSLEQASIESDTRSMDALITRLERPDHVGS